MINVEWLDPAWSPKFYEGANDVKGMVIHHSAGTSIEGCRNRFMDTSEDGSAHYAIKNDVVQQYVHEGDGAWHSGDNWANTHTIGIENVNATGGPDWLVDERTVETCCELMADIAIRHGLLPLKRGVNVWGHRDFSSTYCPGVLYDRLDWMCDRANTIAKAIIDGEEEEDEMAVWTYKNEAMNGDKDAYQMLTDVHEAVTYGGIASLGYKNKAMNGNRDVYQLLTDMDKRLAAIEKKLK